MAIKRQTLVLLGVSALTINVILYFVNMLRSNCGGNDLRLSSTVREHDSFQAEPFQPDNIGCSVRVISDEKIFKKYMQNEKNVQPCSLDYFRRYLNVNKQFVGEGVWFAPSNGTPTPEADFFPKGCTFARELSTVDALGTCFRRKRVGRILVTGDSNAAFIMKTLRSYLENFTHSQPCTRMGMATNNPSYYKIPGLEEGKLSLNVDTEGSGRVRCALPNNMSVSLERIAMLHVMDRSIYLQKITSKADFAYRVFHAESKMEYLLKYYFPHVGFPDIWFLTLPFHHDSWGNSPDKIRADLVYMLNLFDLFLPKSTNVVFVADARECPELRPPQVIQDFTAFWNKTRNISIHELNQVLFAVLWEKTRHSPNLYGFLDADKISCPLVCKWHIDGAHMALIWYEKMTRYILESFCVEVA